MQDGYNIAGYKTLVKDCSAFANGDYGFENNDASTMIIGCIAGGNTTNYGGSADVIHADIEKRGSNYTAQPFENIALVAGGS